MWESHSFGWTDRSELLRIVLSTEATLAHVPSFSYCEEIPVEDNEVNDSSSKSSVETKPDASPQLPKKSITNSTLTSTGSSEAPVSVWAASPWLPPLIWGPAGPSSAHPVGPEPGECVGQVGSTAAGLFQETPGAEGLAPSSPAVPGSSAESSVSGRRFHLASEQVESIQVHCVRFAHAGLLRISPSGGELFALPDLQAELYGNIGLCTVLCIHLFNK